MIKGIFKKKPVATCERELCDVRWYTPYGRSGAGARAIHEILASFEVRPMANCSEGAVSSIPPRRSLASMEIGHQSPSRSRIDRQYLKRILQCYSHSRSNSTRRKRVKTGRYKRLATVIAFNFTLVDGNIAEAPRFCNDFVAVDNLNVDEPTCIDVDEDFP